jgi:hypothetical protein
MANPASTSTGIRRHDTRPSKAARRQSFFNAAVTSDQVRQYLVDVNTYEQFIELIQDHLEEALPVPRGMGRDPKPTERPERARRATPRSHYAND